MVCNRSSFHISDADFTPEEIRKAFILMDGMPKILAKLQDLNGDVRCKALGLLNTLLKNGLQLLTHCAFGCSSCTRGDSQRFHLGGRHEEGP